MIVIQWVCMRLFSASDQESYEPDTIFVLPSYKIVPLQSTLELSKRTKSSRCYGITLLPITVSRFNIIIHNGFVHNSVLC